MELSFCEYKCLNNLVQSCDEMINGKFILADAKIENILNLITQSECLYDLMAQYMADFNYDKEYARARIKSPTKPGDFVLPKDQSRMMPLIFCLLVDLKNHKIDLNNFMREYFSGGDGDYYKNFTSKIILPFKTNVEQTFLKDVEIKEDKKMKKENNQQVEDNHHGYDELFETLQKIIENIIETLSFDPKLSIEQKDNGNIMLKAMIRACKNKDLSILNALIVGFEFYSKKIKSIRFAYNELKETLINFYNEKF